MTWLVFAVAAASSTAARADTIWVSLPEDAGDCSVHRFAPLVAADRKDLDVREGLPDLANPDVHVQIFHQDGRWTLVVRARGHRELVRDLPPPGPSCVDLLQTATFMVERYLDEVARDDQGSTGARPVDKEKPGPAPDPGAWHGLVELGIAGHVAGTGGAAGLIPALRLDVGARSGPWLVGLAGVALLGQPAQPGHEDNTARIVVAQLAVGRRFPIGWGALRVELLGGAAFAAQSSTANAQDGSEQSFATTPFLGAAAGWELPLYRRLFASLQVEGRAFYVGEDPPPWWLDPPLDFDAALGLGYLFF